jgi:NAD(P)-dependent dehydrogenase (short-subunit alcohol dehydrogenase family)
MATVLVTGANRGIGLALARQLHARGDHVIAACRAASPELTALGVQVEAGIDVASAEGPAALAARVRDRRLDVLINNAGVLMSDRLGALEPEAIRAQLEVNALAPLLVTEALRANLKEGAKVAIITSRMGSIADNTSGGMYGYRMSKAAVNAAGASLAVDLRGAGVAVALIHPGYVQTDMTGGHGNVDAETSAAQIIQRIDALRLADTGAFLHANGERLPW